MPEYGGERFNQKGEEEEKIILLNGIKWQKI